MGVPATLGAPTSVFGLASDGQYLYWWDGDSVFDDAGNATSYFARMAIDGTGFQYLAAMADPVGTIVIDGDWVYYGSYACRPADGTLQCTGSVGKFPKVGGSLTTLSDERAIAIAVDETSVYWASDLGLRKLTPK